MSAAKRLAPGDAVVVHDRHPSGHVRTPSYARGRRGVVERVCGEFRNPEALAYGAEGLPRRVLYRVRFQQAELWGDYRGGPDDTVDVEIYAHWLDPV